MISLILSTVLLFLGEEIIHYQTGSYGFFYSLAFILEEKKSANCLSHFLSLSVRSEDKDEVIL